MNSGIRRIAVAVQYKPEQLVEHLQSVWCRSWPNPNEFVELWRARTGSLDTAEYAGTADAVYKNIGRIRLLRPRHVLILAGDHIYKQDYRALIAEHERRGAEVTVSCVEVPLKEASRFGVMDVNEAGEIHAFLEKSADPPCLPNDPTRALASMGIYVFNTEVLLDALEQDAARDSSRRDFGGDIIPHLVGRCRLFAHRYSLSCVAPKNAREPYWRDVGTIEAYWQASIDIVRKGSNLDLDDESWPTGPRRLRWRTAKSPFDKAPTKGTIIDSVLAAGTSVGSSAIVEESVLLPGCRVSEGARLRRCIVADGSVIPGGLVVGEDAEKDARRFHRTATGITIVTPQMLARLSVPTDDFVPMMINAQSENSRHTLTRKEEHALAG
tara:strand:+ start:37 stop:1182 length:1146 start_codon:yes stop_codon:yes gene_type:complete